MSADIPNDYDNQIQQLIAQGKFRDQQKMINEGIRLVISWETLHAGIQTGIGQLDRGQGMDAEDVYAEARRRIKAIE